MTLTAGSNGKAAPKQVRYWDYCVRGTRKRHAPRRTTCEELDHLLQQAVNRQLVSDVDVGAYLSGGMDSGTITAIAAKSLKLYAHLHLRFRSELCVRHRA